MVCDRCGREFPSQYYFNFDLVPGSQVCTECVDKMTPEDKEAFRQARSRLRKPPGLSPNAFVFPPQCCSCCGHAETKFLAVNSYSTVAAVKTLSIEVPICRSCKSHEKFQGYAFVGGIILGALIGLAAGRLPGLIGGGFLGMTAGALVGQAVKRLTEPVTIGRDGRIFFRNPKYEALFKAANSLS